jgi:hypothetical protein
MKRLTLIAGASALVIGLAPGEMFAQQQPQAGGTVEATHQPI